MPSMDDLTFGKHTRVLTLDGKLVGIHSDAVLCRTPEEAETFMCDYMRAIQKAREIIKDPA